MAGGTFDHILEPTPEQLEYTRMSGLILNIYAFLLNLNRKKSIDKISEHDLLAALPDVLDIIKVDYETKSTLFKLRHHNDFYRKINNGFTLLTAKYSDEIGAKILLLAAEHSFYNQKSSFIRQRYNQIASHSLLFKPKETTSQKYKNELMDLAEIKQQHVTSDRKTINK